MRRTRLPSVGGEAGVGGKVWDVDALMAVLVLGKLATSGV
jgi:hypothetical protein